MRKLGSMLALCAALAVVLIAFPGHRPVAQAARTGIGAKLLEDAGLAVLWEGEKLGQGAAVSLFWGAPGLGGEAALPLEIALADGDWVWAPGLLDTEEVGLRASSFARVAGNSVVVDGRLPKPEDLAEKPGQLIAFRAGRLGRVVRATCGEVYPNVLFDRTLLLMEDTVLDVFRAAGEEEYVFDYVLNIAGELREASATLAWEDAPAEALAYLAPRGGRTRRAVCAQSFSLEFAAPDGKRLLGIRFLGAPETEVFVAALGGREAARGSLLVVRRRGSGATFSAVLWPHGPQDGAPMLELDDQGRLFFYPREMKR